MTHTFASGRFVAVDTAFIDNQDDEIAADDGPQREITGVLLSPVLEQSEWSCLRLVYQIIGSGRLEVLQRTEAKGFDKPLWSSQTPSDSWVISSMDLQNNTEPYRVKYLLKCMFILFHNMKMLDDANRSFDSPTIKLWLESKVLVERSGTVQNRKCLSSWDLEYAN